ncbi:DUF58 domain-containing protein [Aerosakkonemataceae cyanobacterium BLCC-F154]|uniref:DUF58 domain-containing protein n=1 Tax=Floridaenema fluviatile BLCC-F154 TaxID=3153640 RepID=A0ABV4YIP4_9CYAN
MRIAHRLADWVESRWVVPAYSGWVLGAFSLCFLAAAINTMAGWLYVISGISLALLAMAATLPVRSLHRIHLQRLPIQPISAGEELTIEIELHNQSSQPKTLLQIRDLIPFVLDRPVSGVIETILPQQTHRWVYYQPTKQRGVYRWHTTQLRTATPLGLFWCRRERQLPATAIVYPTVLPLTTCPLIDEIGQEDSPQYFSRDRRSQLANQDLTRSLRPYRWGDPFRLVHWRTSARYGELRVRELEVFTGGQEVIICLDSASLWNTENFEQAVIAAASLYFYATRTQLTAKLWTANAGLLQGHRVVLEALASVNFGETPGDTPPPDQPIVWLTANSLSLNSLPAASRWLLWPDNATTPKLTVSDRPGIIIQPEPQLQTQLQSGIRN